MKSSFSLSFLCGAFCMCGFFTMDRDNKLCVICFCISFIFLLLDALYDVLSDR